MKATSIIIEEQGPRDGFQVENQWIPTELKVAMIEALVEAGLRQIQVTSFVHPKSVPQMADAEAVCQQLRRREGVQYSGLVLNVKGVERAIKAGLTHVAASLSASETHSRRNAHKGIQASKVEFVQMVGLAKQAGLQVRGGIQCAFGCRYEGTIAPEVVLDLVRHHLDLGVDVISLADSTGMGHPVAIQHIMEQVVSWAPDKVVNLHLHDTEGKGLANMLAAIEVGVGSFDTAFGGMGGCPFIQGATGNIATEDALHMLHQMGIQTGVNLSQVAQVSHQMEVFLGKKFPGKMKEFFK
jgi:hydroxymethylglutaryl-CoA lyase